MGSPTKNELEIMVSIAKRCCGGGGYLLETGSGASTEYFALRGIKVVTIDLFEVPPERRDRCLGTEFLTGWSICDEDMVKFGHPMFYKSRYANTPDEKVALGEERITGSRDLIREAVSKFGIPQFFFCDTGEYCGLAEWGIMKSIIPVNGFVAMHDIHFPKSVKNFLAYEEILKDPDKWELIYKSCSRAGLCVARRIR
ncbi:hypothetical protein KAR91_20710 [Candidatus Pacearchaeota archaeon]|nr:hypothetical protein [Candidatus Pacearchaeota archaeon]